MFWKYFNLTAPQCWLNLLASKLSRNWIKVIFAICMNRVLKNVQNFYSRLIGSWDIRRTKILLGFFGPPFNCFHPLSPIVNYFHLFLIIFTIFTYFHLFSVLPSSTSTQFSSIQFKSIEVEIALISISPTDT